MNINFKPLLEQLAAQPNLTSTTPGPCCPECDGPFIIAYGRASRKWRVLHGGANGGHQCPRYRDQYPACETQAEAIRQAAKIAQEAGE